MKVIIIAPAEMREEEKTRELSSISFKLFSSPGDKIAQGTHCVMNSLFAQLCNVNS